MACDYIYDEELGDEEIHANPEGDKHRGTRKKGHDNAGDSDFFTRALPVTEESIGDGNSQSDTQKQSNFLDHFFHRTALIGFHPMFGAHGNIDGDRVLASSVLEDSLDLVFALRRLHAYNAAGGKIVIEPQKRDRS